MEEEASVAAKVNRKFLQFHKGKIWFGDSLPSPSKLWRKARFTHRSYRVFLSKLKDSYIFSPNVIMSWRQAPWQLITWNISSNTDKNGQTPPHIRLRCNTSLCLMVWQFMMFEVGKRMVYLYCGLLGEVVHLGDGLIVNLGIFSKSAYTWSLFCGDADHTFAWLRYFLHTQSMILGHQSLLYNQASAPMGRNCRQSWDVSVVPTALCKICRSCDLSLHRRKFLSANICPCHNVFLRMCSFISFSWMTSSTIEVSTLFLVFFHTVPLSSRLFPLVELSVHSLQCCDCSVRWHDPLSMWIHLALVPFGCCCFERFLSWFTQVQSHRSRYPQNNEIDGVHCQRLYWHLRTFHLCIDQLVEFKHEHTYFRTSKKGRAFWTMSIAPAVVGFDALSSWDRNKWAQSETTYNEGLAISHNP